MQIDLSALGVSEEKLIDSVLAQTGLSREDAVVALANRLGVEIMNADDYKPDTQGVSDGDEVLTTRGAARAAVLTEAEQATLREAAAISQRLFS